MNRPLTSDALTLAEKQDIIEMSRNGFDTVQSIAYRLKLPRDTVRAVIDMVRS